MSTQPRRLIAAFSFLLLASFALAAQETAPPKSTTAADAPSRDTSFIDAEGTAHVTRVVPVPEALSFQSRIFLSRPEPDQGPPQSLAERRKSTDAYTASAREEWKKICPVTIEDRTMAGVPVHVVTPPDIPAANHDRILLNLHGGGFNSDSGSYTESLPIASYT